MSPSGLTDLLAYNILTIFTSMFLHGGVLHVAGNMLYLWIFGNNVEDAAGHLRFLGFYLCSGLAACAAQFSFDPSSTVPMIGASGAVSGILGAYLLLFPWARVKTLIFILVFITTVDIPAVVLLTVWFIMQIAFSQGQGVAWFAHIGGFIFGLVAIKVFMLGKGGIRRRRRGRGRTGESRGSLVKWNRNVSRETFFSILVFVLTPIRHKVRRDTAFASSSRQSDIYDVSAYGFWSAPLGLSLRGEYPERERVRDRAHRLPQGEGRKERGGREGAVRQGEGSHPEAARFVRKRFRRYGLSREEIGAKLRAMAPPDLVLVTGIMTYWYQGVSGGSGVVRETFPATKIVVGGVYASLCHEHAERHMAKADLIVGTGRAGGVLRLRGGKLREKAEDQARCRRYRTHALSGLRPLRNTPLRPPHHLNRVCLLVHVLRHVFLAAADSQEDCEKRS